VNDSLLSAQFTLVGWLCDTMCWRRLLFVAYAVRHARSATTDALCSSDYNNLYECLAAGRWPLGAGCGPDRCNGLVASLFEVVPTVVPPRTTTMDPGDSSSHFCAGGFDDLFTCSRVWQLDVALIAAMALWHSCLM
jgi:hypothetical protein